MVKVQKPIPKTMGNKPKLNNPMKSKNQKPHKGKSSGTLKNVGAGILDSPIIEAKKAKKPLKQVQQKAVEPKKAKKVPEPPGSLALQKPNVEVNAKKNKKSPNENVLVKNGVKKAKKTLDSGNLKSLEVVAPAGVPPKASAPVKSGKKPVKAVALPKPDPKPVKAALEKKVKGPAPNTKKLGKTPVPTPALVSNPIVKAKPAAPPQSKPKKGKKKSKKAEVPATEPSVEIAKPEDTKPKLQEKKLKKIAFKKAKLAEEEKPWIKLAKKEKIEQRVKYFTKYEPVPFDEDKFNAIVSVENIKKIAEALKTVVEKEVAMKKSSIFDDYRYTLRVSSFKIPSCPKRMVKLNLKHPLVDKDDDVLMIVPDLQRGAKVDYEPTLHHYEDLLRYHGVEGVKVMPMNQLRQEYTTFEQKRRLLASYDHYLCDGRLVSHVVGLVGNLGQKPRTTFHAVRLDEDKEIKTEIEKSMRRTAYRQLTKSNLQTIPIGTHKFTSQQLAENVQIVVEQLKKLFPGGAANIRNLHLKIEINGTSSLPLYISMGQAPEDTPVVIGPREERMKKLKREANEVLSKFAMTKEGKLIKLSKTDVKKKREQQELKAALKADAEVPAKKLKKSKAAKKADQDAKKDEVKELELPENEEEDDEENDSSDDDEDNVGLEAADSSDNDEESADDMGQMSDDDSADEEIVENGLLEEADEESEQDSDGSDNDDEEEQDDDVDDDDDDEEEIESD